jgi:transcriptional regulator with XRE-family HTH domain
MKGAHDPLYIEFIARLRKARKAKRLSQAAFGKLIGEEQSFVSKVETCERRLDIIEAARWCAALGLALDDALPAELRGRCNKCPQE